MTTSFFPLGWNDLRVEFILSLILQRADRLMKPFNLRENSKE